MFDHAHFKAKKSRSVFTTLYQNYYRTFKSVVPKEKMTEEELRALLPQLVQDPASAEAWKQIAKKDPIEILVAWFKIAGYSVEITEE